MKARLRLGGASGPGHPPADVVAAAALPRGEKVLAHGQEGDRWILGTRAAVLLVEPAGTVRLPWETVQAADWDNEANLLRITEVGEYGRPRAAYQLVLENPALLLQLIRERVTASVVLQQGHLVSGKRGFKVIGRRSPTGVGPIRWMFEFDAGIDPDDPLVVLATEDALARARGDVGE